MADANKTTPKCGEPSEDDHIEARRQARNWVKGCSADTKRALSTHEVSALETAIAYACARARQGRYSHGPMRDVDAAVIVSDEQIGLMPNGGDIDISWDPGGDGLRMDPGGR